MNSPGYNEAKTIELAKLFIDTGIIKNIFFNDGDVAAATNAYAIASGNPGVMSYWDGHEDHFHVRIADEFRGIYSERCAAW